MSVANEGNAVKMDDLVERLRVGSIWGQSVQDILIDWMKERKQAADRIEELEANINLKADFIDATINQLEAAEQRGYASAMEAERKLHEDRIKELEAALLEAKSEMRDWGPDHPAMKMIDAALEGQNDD